MRPSAVPLSCSTASVSGAAALVAERLAPGARAWWLAGHRSTRARPHRGARASSSSSPCSTSGLRLGEGTGALLAVPLLQAAAASLTMATFDEAGVSDRQPPADPRPWDGLRLALTTFTVLPLPAGRADRRTAGAAMAWAPVVGAGLGGVLALLLLLLRQAFPRGAGDLLLGVARPRGGRPADPRACTSTGWPTRSTGSAATADRSGRWRS